RGRSVEVIRLAARVRSCRASARRGARQSGRKRIRSLHTDYRVKGFPSGDTMSRTFARWRHPMTRALAKAVAALAVLAGLVLAAPLKKLRGIAGIYPNYIQIVASAESGIKTLADLKGKRVSVGAPKSGTELNARAVLKAAGLGYKDLSKVEYLPFGESVELMKNRQLDVTLQSAGLGVSALRDLAEIGRAHV